MTTKLIKQNSSGPLAIGIALILLTSSFYYDLFFWTFDFNIDSWTLLMIRLGILGTVGIVLQQWYDNKSHIVNLLLVLCFVLCLDWIQKDMLARKWFVDMFSFHGDLGEIIGNIMLKFIAAASTFVLLHLLYPHDDASSLGLGDMDVDVEPIGFLGIKKHELTWSRLSWLSGGLITVGTLALTWITVIGKISEIHYVEWISQLPLIGLMAMLNSFSEGVTYRLVVIESLRRVLHKSEVVLLSAVLFGSHHYFGAPGGILGVLMSTLLGWFLARSTYETKGFLSSWIIHFMQDAVIFSLLVLMS